MRHANDVEIQCSMPRASQTFTLSSFVKVANDVIFPISKTAF